MLLNKCDGYHLAEPMFDDQGNFECFYLEGGDFAYPDGRFYEAWGALPDSFEELHPIFVDG